MRLKRHQMPNGFSLIELLVVVAIVVIMAGVAAPSVVSYLRVYRIRAAADDVAGELTRARGRAVMTNTNRGVLFLPGVDNAGGVDNDFRFQFWVEEDPRAPGVPAAVPIPDENGRTDGPPNGVVRRLPNGVRFVPVPGAGVWGGHAIRFDRLGRACLVGSAGACPDANGGPTNDPLVSVAPRLAGDPPTNGSRIELIDMRGQRMAVDVGPGGTIRVRDLPGAP